MTATILPTRNEPWSFWGTMGRSENRSAQDVARAWNVAFRKIAEVTGASAEGVRDFLDSRHGRHSVGRAAATGAGLGGLYGFGEGEGGLGPRAASAGVSGALGGVAGGAIGAAGQRIARGVARGAGAKAAPTIDDLMAQAGDLYRRAEASGVTATQQQVGQAADTIRGLAQREGLISRSGRVSTAYPKVRGALRTLDDAAGGPMTPTEMQSTRKLLQGVARSADDQEARIGTLMLRDFDDWVAGFAPELREARALYSRAMRGEEIGRAIELAHQTVGQHGRSFGDALRHEFGKLDRAIINGKLKGLTQAEIDAIRKVARGGPVENALRLLGKFAPTGVVSLGVGGGLGTAAGLAAGSPLVGIGAAAGVGGAGLAGRAGAKALTSRSADMASALARGGGTLPPVAPGAAMSAATQGLPAAPAPWIASLAEALMSRGAAP